MDSLKMCGLYNYSSTREYIKALNTLKKLHERKEHIVMYPPARRTFKVSVGRVRFDFAQIGYLVAELRNRKKLKKEPIVDTKALKKSNKYVNTYMAIDEIIEMTTLSEAESIFPIYSGISDICTRIYKALEITGYTDLNLLANHIEEVFEIFDTNMICKEFYMTWSERDFNEMRRRKPWMEKDVVIQFR